MNRVADVTRLQRRRLGLQVGFFILFVLAPVLDIFRIDLNLKHLIFFGHDWTLGLDGFLAGRTGIADVALNLLLRGFIPLAAVIGGGVWLSWKYGRLYCGWLCPHFSVVEILNRWMRRASAKQSLWDRRTIPPRDPDGAVVRADPRYWPLVVALAIFFAGLWAVTLLTYLLPPSEIYRNLWQGTLTRNQQIFLTVATLVFSVEFLFARHLFCRFGCAVGLFQSLAWMANRQAMVIGFDRRRANHCTGCASACEHVCPMRLKPRTIKRAMFACTQCGRCTTACAHVQADHPAGTLLQWVRGAAALDQTGRDFGLRPAPLARHVTDASPLGHSRLAANRKR